MTFPTIKKLTLLSYWLPGSGPAMVTVRKIHNFRQATEFQVNSTAEMLKLRIAFEDWKKAAGTTSSHDRRLKSLTKAVGSAERSAMVFAKEFGKLADLADVLARQEKDFVKLVRKKGSTFDQHEAAKKRLLAMDKKLEAALRSFNDSAALLALEGKFLERALKDARKAAL